MKYSVPMICNILEEKSIRTEQHIRKNTFYINIQFCDESSMDLTDSYIYIVQNLSMLKSQPLTDNFGLLLLEKPENELPCNYALIKDEISASHLANELFGAIARFQTFEHQLVSYLYEDNALEKALTVLTRFMKNPVYIMDTRYKFIAFSNAEESIYNSPVLRDFKEQGYMPMNIVMKLVDNEVWQQIAHTADPVLMSMNLFYRPFINCGLYFEDSLQGYLIVVELYKKLSQSDIDLFKQIIPYFNQMCYRYIPDANHRGNYYEIFFKEMINGTLRNQSLISELLQPLGWKTDDRYMLLMSEISSFQTTSKDILFTRLMHIKNGKPVFIDTNLYCIFRIENAEDEQQIISECSKIFSSIRAKCAVSDVFRGLSNLGSQAIIIEKILHIGSVHNSKKFLYKYEEYKMQVMLYVCEDTLELNNMIHKDLFTLSDYDLENDTHYFLTLFEYLKNERKTLETADALKIHRNTLRYRIEKITDLIESNLDNHTERMQLFLSYAIWFYKH